MNYELNEAQNKMMFKYAAYCRDEIKVNAQELDLAEPEMAEKIIKDNIAKLGKLGFLGLFHSKDDGGSGDSYLSAAVTGEQVAKACPATYFSVLSGSIKCSLAISSFGTEEQKKKYLPSLIDGSLIGSFSLTEYSGGIDESAIKTEAEKRDGKWIIDGKKSYVFNSTIADIFIVFAKDVSGNKNSVFIIEKNSSGLKMGKRHNTMGLRGVPVGEVILDDCVVEDGALLGKPGEGHEILSTLNSKFAFFNGIGSLGIASAAMDASNAYSKERKTFGRFINRYQEVSFKLADMMIMSDVARLMLYKAGWDLDENNRDTESAISCAKLFSSEAATQITGWAVQIHGGKGFIEGNEVERLFRDAKFGEISGGTSEMHRVSIAETLIEKYKS